MPVTRQQRFVFEFTVSRRFLRESPAAARWIAARQEQIARLTSAIGPRGGRYRLDPAPTEWRACDNDTDFFMRNLVLFWTTRTGRYVRPSRVTPDLLLAPPPFVLGSVEYPVVGGLALLPDGRIVRTKAKTVTVPVPPR